MPKKSSPSTASTQRFWLVKSEPDVFSIDDLARAKNRTTHWDGVRNYQARNMLRDEMQVGDAVLYYHSNAEPTAIVGTARVVRAGYPDFTAWDENDPHFDPKSTAENPRWYMVDIQLVEKFDKPLTLQFLRSVPELKDMELLRKGSRLSVQPVTPDQYAAVVRLAKT
ncbi:MAG: EVE domain-containing protein [Aureliella sp.]